jgi:hypothetical protein
MRATIDFLLYDWLRIETLLARPRFADHSRSTFGEVLDTCERIARDRVAPFNRTVDVEEPRVEDGRVVLPQSSVDAALAYVESGMLAAAQDYEIGGMQLPCAVEMAANSFYSKAGIGVGGGMLLTSGNANLLRVQGTAVQREVFARNEFAGRWFGTMCLSEPHAGSSLSDITTRAEPDGADHCADPLGARYRLRGNKMWISNGDHEITENIIHLDSRRFLVATAGCHRAPAGSRCSSSRRSSSTLAGSSRASATTLRSPGSITSSATAASRIHCSTSAKDGSRSPAPPARSAISSASRARGCAACST